MDPFYTFLTHRPKETYPITGIKAGIKPGSSAVPLRLEVDSWYPPPDVNLTRQVSLFILALRFFQSMDPDEKLSYFQVAGIHGFPFMPWDEDTDAQTANEGYCTHDSLLFPCWHRPYVLLYEQRLYEIMVNEIIPKYPESMREDFLEAATTFRLPYWDWAAKKKRSGEDSEIYDIPLIAKEPTIEVLSFDGTSPTSVPNPMYKFTMPGDERMGCSGVGDVQDTTSDGEIMTIPFSKSRGTSRWALYDPESSTVSVEWQEGDVDNSMIAEALEEHDWYGTGVENVPIAEMVYRLFLPDYIKSFTQFATTKYHEEKPAASYLSLEYIHNNIHNWVGGFDSYVGHMTEPPVAAFDPIFWMHHCNVDRQFAIWQALNDSKWFEESCEQLPDDGTWSIKAETIDTPEIPLAPFHSDTEGTYYTSNGIRDWMKLGYSYTELQPWLDKYKKDGKYDKELYVKDVKDQLKKLYRPAEMKDYPADVIVNAKYKRFGLGGVPYTLHFFIGSPEELQDYRGPLHKHQHHVGFIYNFSSPIYKNRSSPGCERCRRKATEGTMSTAQVPITGAILARIGSNSPFNDVKLIEDREWLTQYLKDNLRWKVLTLGGHEVPDSTHNSFIEVSVHHGKVGFDEERQMPRLGSYKPLSLTD